jgi:hypothetical protein
LKFPGPGQYTQNNKTISGRTALDGLIIRTSFSKAKRHDLALKNSTPGPGAYKLPAKFNELQSYQIPKEQRIIKI